MMLGGVICGYWATGRLTTATPPASVMTIDSTEAKIGRLMKKCENIFDRKVVGTLRRAVGLARSDRSGPALSARPTRLWTLRRSVWIALLRAQADPVSVADPGRSPVVWGEAAF